ncbi:MAG: emopamil-binding family protein [Pseudomonadota bacterium]
MSKRRIDWVLLAYFFVNLTFITYIVDVEQIIIADPNNFIYPIWPPKVFVDLIHWYGRTFDPVLMARPVWWRVTIWWDSLLFGPFYVLAIYAYIRGRNWIRIPGIIWASIMLAGVAVILAEEMWGPHATPNRPMVLALNAPWFLIPLFVLVRNSLKPNLFGPSHPVEGGGSGAG